jgi:glycine/D-amino acid oxidase-like deaminating enzyme
VIRAGVLRVVVIGAGIIGAAIAWHVARRGARVTVVDAGERGGIATRHSWAWINASWGNPEPYFRLRVRALQEWHRLEQELTGLPLAWSGSLNWELPADRLQAFAAQHAAWGYDIRCVGRAEVRRLEPALRQPPDLAVHAPQEGAVEPVVAAHRLLAAVEELGAAVVTRNAVHSIIVRGGQVVGVRTASNAVDADRVVVAAGAGTAAIAATAGLTLPVADPPALLVVTKPCARLLNGLVMTPAMQLRQALDGRLLATASFDGHDHGDAAAAADIFAAIRTLLACEPFDLDFHAVGRRPIPADRMPLIGPACGVEGLYVAVTHSGVTLAPAIGRFVADELLHGQRDPLLAPFGLERVPQS